MCGVCGVSIVCVCVMCVWCVHVWCVGVCVCVSECHPTHTLQSFQVAVKRGWQQERSVVLQLLKSAHACVMMVITIEAKETDSGKEQDPMAMPLGRGT